MFSLAFQHQARPRQPHSTVIGRISEKTQGQNMAGLPLLFSTPRWHPQISIITVLFVDRQHVANLRPEI